MKKLYFFVSFLFLSFVLPAQNNIYLKLNHFLGNSTFAFNQTVTNNMDSDFQLSRMEYYISSIVITHDSGQTTAVPSKWVLVNADSTTYELLGNFPAINRIESIQFGIGVESAVNHSDPSSYPSNHPLAPKSPSMHWGWSAGYRFAAIEGLTGTNMSELFQIHALGDRNYFTQTVTVSAIKQNGISVINLDVDYLEALKNIVINGNLINHGEQGEAATLLSNFSRSGVFSQSTVGVSTIDTPQLSYRIFPNPSTGNIRIQTGKTLKSFEYTVFDMTGKIILSGNMNTAENNQLTIEQPGIYFLSIQHKGKKIKSKKVIIQ